MPATDPEVPRGERITDSAAPRRASGAGHPFAVAAGWTVLGTLVPGLGLLRAGRRVAGAVVMALFFGLAVVVGGFALFDPSGLIALTADPAVLDGAAIGALLLAGGWVGVIVTTYLALRPRPATTGTRAAGALLVAALAFAVAAPLAVGADLAHTTAGLVRSLFSEQEGQSATQPTIANTADPWAEKPRLNILVIGGDHDEGREAALSIRADTVMVASIDTHTGATTLVGLPRNTSRMPFPKKSPLHKYFPDGFTGPGKPDEWYLNAMYRNVPALVPAGILGKTKNLGADVMKLSVGEALGLGIDYYVQIDMDGFKEFVNAIGGITVNVNYRVPIGGNTDLKIPPTGWIEPEADKHLDGRLALWYARGRYGMTDYDRMERQRCVIHAVAQQATPAKVLANFEKIAKASERSIRTDVPRTMLAPMTELAGRIKGSKLRSISFETGVDGWNYLAPDWPKARARVKKAIQETAAATPDATATPSATAAATSSPASAKPRSDDLDQVCAYHPR